MTTRHAVAAVLGITFLCLAAAWPAAAQEETWMVLAKGTVTTSSLLYPNPGAVDPLVRGQSYAIDASYGYGAEIRYRFSDAQVAVGLSAEYLKASFDHPIRVNNTALPVSDGYTVVPVELTGYFLIPFAGETFGVFMGGGGGLYFGRREYSVGSTASSAVSSRPGAGIHVLAGVSYRPAAHLMILGEMKFRDLQFRSVSRFDNVPPLYRSILRATEEASVHTDGIIFQVGLGFSF